MILHILGDIADGFAVEHRFLRKAHLEDLFRAHGELHQIKRLYPDILQAGLAAQVFLGPGDLVDECDELAESISLRLLVRRTRIEFCLQLGTEVVCHAHQSSIDCVMALRKRSSVVARSWLKRLRPSHRAELEKLYGGLHDPSTEPGLTHISASGTVDHDGLDIAWYEVGQQGAPVTVVFIHGYCLSSEAYYDQANYLRGRNARALLVDLRGHGQSSTVDPEECTVDAAADDVLAVIRERAPRGNLVIVGHSLGGMVALNLIRRAPAEVYERIKGALLISTSMRRFAAKGVAQILQSKSLHTLYRLCLRLPGRVDSARFEVARFMAPLFAATLAGFPQMEKLQFHVAMLLDTPLASYSGFFDDLLEHSEYGAAERLAKLHGEVVVGTADIVTPRSQSEVLCENWPAASLQTVEGSGHMVILEDPEAISTALGRVLDAI